MASKQAGRNVQSMNRKEEEMTKERKKTRGRASSTDDGDGDMPRVAKWVD